MQYDISISAACVKENKKNTHIDWIGLTYYLTDGENEGAGGRIKPLTSLIQSLGRNTKP